MPEYRSPGVYVEEVPPAARPIAGVGTSTAGFIGIVPDQVDLPAPLKGQPGKFVSFSQTIPTPAKQARLITNWAEFVKNFGDLVGPEQETGTAATAPITVNAGYRNLAWAVYGFFDNGGTSSYVIRVAADTALGDALTEFAKIDDIAIVALPGVTAKASQDAIITHCEQMQDRVAVLDAVQDPGEYTVEKVQGGTKVSTYAALYFPWIKVSDPATKLMQPAGDGSLFIPPSGHIAGVYARVDGARGVHKAPGNEAVRGALDVQFPLTKGHRDTLNPAGINVLRTLSGAAKIWGARTLGGDANAEFKYISTRRLFNFLRESIDEGTQWVVFEPNSQALWQRIKRNVSDFLLGQWRDGALFGDKPEKGFFVKCDEETNPPDVRERGQVITEIGVAIVKPAEFVIFRIQQMTGG